MFLVLYSLSPQKSLDTLVKTKLVSERQTGGSEGGILRINGKSYVSFSFRYCTKVMERCSEETEEMLQSIRRLFLEDDQVLSESKCAFVHGELCPMLLLR